MPLRRASQFFTQDVWTEAADEARGLRAVFYRQSRVFSLAVRGFIGDDGAYRASALAFDTVLGLVPFGAFLVAALKGFGAWKSLVSETLRPAINQMMTQMGDTYDPEVVTLRSAFLRVLDFVDRTNFGSLGVVGLVLLLFVVVVLLMSVERSLNHIFGVERDRGLARKVADYSAILFITPLCAMVAATITSRANQFELLGRGVILEAGSIVAMSLGLAMLYIVMPFTRVRVRSAMYGALVAGVFWYIVLNAHVQFQLGVARYNAVYSTFAAIPLFLVWVFVSWLVVLFGAELTAAHQNTSAFRWRVQEGEAAFAAREYVALRSMVAIGEAFLSGEPPPLLSELAKLMRAPERLVEGVLDALVDRCILVRATRRGQRAYALARDIDGVRVSSVIQAIEHANSFDLPEPRSSVDQRVRDVLDTLVAARERSSRNYTLRQLVEAAGGSGVVPRPLAEPHGGGGSES